MVKIQKFTDTPSQTAGPFLHIGCTPSIVGINIFKDELGSAPFKNISLNEEINIKGKTTDDLGIIGNQSASSCQVIISLTNA